MLEYFTPVKSFYLMAPGNLDIWFKTGNIYPCRFLLTLWPNSLDALEMGWIKILDFKDINELIKLIILQDTECTTQE